MSMNRREFGKAIGVGAGACAMPVALRAAATPARKKPNFVVFFIDDMGYGDIEPFGSTLNRTPHLNRMAKEGMKLTSFYVACGVCSPSRAALMTGSYPIRVGLAEGSWHAVLMPGDRHGLNPSEITIADLLKEQGYATGCFGKWHLGDQPQFLPRKQGFDYYYGIPYSNDMWPPNGGKSRGFPPLPILRNEEVVGKVETMDEQAQLCKLFTDEAVSFIRNNQDRPFFVYIPHAFVHHPRAARPEFMAKTKNPDKATGAQIEECDWSAGQVLDVLRELKLADNTLVIFTSDNGGARGCVNAPLRGGKGSLYEGGRREPTLAWWPGTVPAGSVCDEMVTAMDLLPTFAKLAGTKAPTDRVIDGKDIAPLLRGEPGAKTPHEMHYYYGRRVLGAVRAGKWKLFKTGQLYDLSTDIGEKKNVAHAHGDVVAHLQAYFQQAREDLGDGATRGKNCRPVGVAANPRVILPREGVSGEAAYAPTGPQPRGGKPPGKKKPKGQKK